VLDNPWWVDVLYYVLGYLPILLIVMGLLGVAQEIDRTDRW